MMRKLKKTLYASLLSFLLCSSILLTGCQQKNNQGSENSDNVADGIISSEQSNDENQPNASKDAAGLTYKLREYNKTCTITGIGTYESSELIVPGTIDGYTVVEIDDNAFSGCEQLTSVVLPNSITRIGDEAFAYCAELTDMVLPDSVTSLGRDTFYMCIKLNAQTFENDIVYIGNWAVDIRDRSMTHITLRENTIGIADDSFDNCHEVTAVSLPDGLMYIGDEAFDSCEKLKEIYFTGTEEEWNIQIGNSNDPFVNATRYYYSEAKPTTKGNYWRYVDGVPQIWESSGNSTDEFVEFDKNESGNLEGGAIVEW